MFSGLSTVNGNIGEGRLSAVTAWPPATPGCQGRLLDKAGRGRFIGDY